MAIWENRKKKTFAAFAESSAAAVNVASSKRQQRQKSGGAKVQGWKPKRKSMIMYQQTLELQKQIKQQKSIFKQSHSEDKMSSFPCWKFCLKKKPNLSYRSDLC